MPIGNDGCTENATFDSTTGRCCQRCEAGFGVALPCTLQNDTVCSACQDGVTYSPVSSHESVCRPCSHCPSNSFTMHQCNATHNTKCECVNGYYYRADKNMCLTCAQCPAGHYMTKACSTTTNTQCRRCPPNGFMTMQNAATSCIPCSSCHKDVAVVNVCTSVRDTQCADGISVPHSIAVNDESEQNLMAIYCVVFAMLLVSLIAYVLLKHFQVKSCSANFCFPAAKSGGQAVAGNGRRPSLRKDCLLLANDGASLAKIEPCPGVLLNYQSPVGQLPPTLIEQLERELQTSANGSDHCELQAFSRALHLSKDRLQRFKQTALENDTTVAKELFRHLCTDGSVRLQVLINALKLARRVDLVLLVQKCVDNRQTILIL